MMSNTKNKGKAMRKFSILIFVLAIGLSVGCKGKTGPTGANGTNGNNGSNGGTAVLIADGQTLKGDMTADSISNLNITLQNKSLSVFVSLGYI